MSSAEDDQRPTRPYAPGQEEGGLPPTPESELAAPTRLGRYVLLGFIGAGGMGVVYTAYDPQLDRKVALKLLRPLPPGPAQEEQQGRLLREARAMAKLAHPHVVHVHDAGEVGSQVYLAMELVEGQDLRRWMRSAPRGWEEIREVLFQAGQGLAAAHRAGLVHRDFKPENVLIGVEGRVRVSDFGLAAPAAPTAGSPEVTSPPVPVVGTPEYLAPEQLWGAASDPRADQFSFCVTLYEALYGALPFGGDNPAQRATAATLGELRPPPEGSAVPAWLRAVVARGLSAEADSRFPSMEALLTALQPRPPVRRRRWLRVTVTVAVASFAFVTLWNWNQQRLLQSCEGGEARLGLAWDAASRQRVEAAFLASGTPGAAELSRRVQAALDRYAQGWLATRREVCVATRVRRVTPAPVMEARLECLETRAAGLGALTRLLSAADGALVLRAPQAVDALESVAACATAVPAPAHSAPLPPGLSQRLVEARARFQANQVDQTLAESRSLLNAAAEAGAPGLVAEAALLECEALTLQEDAAAREGCLGAALRAEEARLPIQAAFAWTHLVQVTTNEGEHDRARLWMQIARSMVARLDGRSEEAAARLANAEGFAAFGAGDYAQAAEAWGRDLAIRERALPEQAWDRAAALTNLGIARLRQGQAPRALEALERGLLLHRQVLGDDHPELASIMAMIAMAKMNLGQVQAARELFQASIALRRRFLGPEANVSLELGNLGWLDSERGAYAESLAHFEEAQRLREESVGPDHPFVAASLLGRAEALVGLGRTFQAVPLAQRAVAMREAKYGARHPLTADAYRKLGTVLIAAGQRRAGMASLRKGVEVSEQVREPGHLETALTLLAAAEGALALDDAQEAQGLAQRAARLLSSHPGRPINLARLHSLLARCHRALGDREAARTEAQRADGLFASFAQPGHPEWAQVRSLLDALAPPSASP